MPSPRVEFVRVARRTARWLLPAALLALTPKCVLCVLAYAGLGTALGLAGPEWCSASASSPASWTTSLAWLGLGGIFGAVGILVRCRKRLSAAHEHSR